MLPQNVSSLLVTQLFHPCCARLRAKRLPLLNAETVQFSNRGAPRPCSEPFSGGRLACVAWRFWLGALSNKGGRGQRNREEIGAEATLFFSRLRRSFSGASRANFAATPLLRPAQQNRHATQASGRLLFAVCVHFLNGSK